MNPLVALLALLSAFPATISAAGWTPSPTVDPPRTQYAALGGVACPAAGDCLAVGTSVGVGVDAVNTALSERFDGGAWTSVPVAGTIGGLARVQCVSPSACIAVGGFDAAPVGERWNGSAWSVMGAFGRKGDAVTDLSCASATSCLAVGYRTSGATAARWDGARWQDLAVPHRAAALWGVACTAPDACTVVGRSRDHAHKSLVLHWDGGRWSVQHDAARAGQVNGAIACAAPDACLAAAAAPFSFDSGTVHGAATAERWDGRRWRSASTGLPRGADVRDIDCRSARDCTAVGQDYVRRQALALHWNGSRWTPIATPHLLPGPLGSPFDHEFPVLNAVSCPAGGRCVAVGARAISRTESRTLAETG